MSVRVVLRPAARRWIAGFPAWGLALGIVAAGAPWVVVIFAPITINVNVHSLPVLALWILGALVAFVLLVPLPLAALLAVVVWVAAQRRRAGAPIVS